MSATTTTGAAPSLALLQKLQEVAQAIDFVEKRGTNQHHNYSFVQALDVVRDVRRELLARSIIVLPGATNARQESAIGGRGGLILVDLLYRFFDTETGAYIEVPWVGAGSDTGGDKGLYKAYTGGLKYVLLGTFLLPMTDDPEHDGLSQRAPAQQEAASASVDKDAERPAAPRIPLDRARLIAEAAEAAGLLGWEGEGEDRVVKLGVALRAKLAEVGVDKIGALDSDQAEAVEAFIALEAVHVGELPVDGAFS
jgi:hypothetical protein